jgi:hypothetical protein
MGEQGKLAGVRGPRHVPPQRARASVAQGRAGAIVRIVLLVATFQLGRLGDPLTARGFLWLLAG